MTTRSTSAEMADLEAAYHAAQAQKADLLRKLQDAGAADNAASFFEHCVDRHGESMAVSAVDGPTRYTFKELDAAANRIAWWAVSEGVGLRAGDTACLLMENRPEFLAFTNGLAKCGVTVALLNTNLTGDLLAHAVETSSCRVLICSVKKRGNLLPAMRGFGKQRLEVWWYAGEGLDVPAEEVGEGKALNASLLRSFPDRRMAKEARKGVGARDPLYYIFTSGTTGPSKAAKFSHKRFVGAAVTWAGPSGLEKGDPYYITLPLYHGNAGVVAVAPCYLIGNPIVLREKFSASNFFKDIRDHNCKATIYIGELWRYLHSLPPTPQDATPSFSPLRVIIGNGLRLELWTATLTRFHITTVVEHYGSTEMPGDAILNHYGRPGSCGYLPAAVAKAKGMSGEGGLLVRYDVEADEV
ncbi:hypothetical protein HK101_006929, partial [Irineochytrium annulatum]